MKKRVERTVEMTLPVTVKVTIEVDDENEDDAEIVEASWSHLQDTMTPRFLMEHDPDSCDRVLSDAEASRG
jgi:hypothetical protein